MALVDISKTAGIHRPTDEEVYLARHWNAVYEARRARDQERHRPRVEPVEITEPEEHKLEPEYSVGNKDVYAGRPTSPERRHSLTEMARRFTAGHGHTDDKPDAKPKRRYRRTQ